MLSHLITSNKPISPLPVPDTQAANIRLVIFDFDGVFTDNFVWTSQDGIELVRCSRSDGLGLKRLREAGVQSWVLTEEINPVVALRCKKLGIPCIQGLDNKNKKQQLYKLADRFKIPLEQVAYLGNDINDFDCLRAVGVPIVVRDAFPEVAKKAKYQTERKGGEGAVREVCDWIVACKNYEKT